MINVNGIGTSDIGVTDCSYEHLKDWSRKWKRTNMVVKKCDNIFLHKQLTIEVCVQNCKKIDGAVRFALNCSAQF